MKGMKGMSPKSGGKNIGYKGRQAAKNKGVAYGKKVSQPMPKHVNPKPMPNK